MGMKEDKTARKEEIGNRIREYRQKLGITQAGLAKAIGQSTSSIGMYENGKRAPELDVLEDMADVFGVSLMQMVSGVEAKRQDKQLGPKEMQDNLVQAFLADRSRALNTLESMRQILDASVPKKASVEARMTKEDRERLEALHQNPKLGLLFDRSRKMSHEDVELMLRLAEKITGERSKSDD